MMLPPGSVFKALTAVALLETGIVNPDTPVYCQGFLDTPNRHRCWHGLAHGDVDLSDALCRSCNVYFFTAARRMGANPIIDWAERFGFGRPTGIDLPGERGGNLPAQQQPPGVIRQVSATSTGIVSDMQSDRSSPYMGNALGLAIGQATLTVTPLQVARLMAAVANGGYLVTPHVARSTGPALVGDDESDTVGLYEPRRIPGLSPDTLDRVREGLRKVVANPRGTGYKRVRLEQISVAGKTGTAEVGGGQEDHAWFAGYVPADKPRIAFAVVLEHGGSGGRNAGPIARSLIEAMLELEILQPTQVSMSE
jgi:penicillin-binding protein 2